MIVNGKWEPSPKPEKDGFYKVEATGMFNGTMETIALFTEGGWSFAQGDGDEQGSGMEVVEIKEFILEY
jgi:hypothetical protein